MQLFLSFEPAPSHLQLPTPMDLLQSKLLLAHDLLQSKFLRAHDFLGFVTIKIVGFVTIKIPPSP